MRFHLWVLCLHAETPLDEWLFCVCVCCPYWCNMHAHNLELVIMVKMPSKGQANSVILQTRFHVHRKTFFFFYGNAAAEMCTWKAGLIQAGLHLFLHRHLLAWPWPCSLLLGFLLPFRPVSLHHQLFMSDYEWLSINTLSFEISCFILA